MKKIVLMAIAVCLSTMLYAQITPDGMNYQAVARNLKGEILADQPVSLKVALFSSGDAGRLVYYKEEHSVVTSAAGVFSLIIGKGNVETGLFNRIPWDKENIWLEVSIKSRGQGVFTAISNSKLLAVPYAYHALTADKIVGNTSSVNGPGVPSQNWSLFGNSNSNANTDKLGTTDSVDLVIVTNNRDRLRILANGNVVIKRSVAIGANLNVDSSVFLNKVSGATINYGPFTVERQSTTLLSGKLIVDLATDLNSSLNVDGITDLNSKLNVNFNSPSLLTGTLTVNGATDLNNAFSVNNISPSILSGTLRVDKDATFNEKIKILSVHQTDTAGVTPSGSLQVGGGAYIAKNLYIGGIAKFGGPAAFGGAVTMTDPSESTSPITGALMIPNGGLGVGKRLNVGGATALGSSLSVTGLTALNDVTQSTLATNGALVVSGGVGVVKNLNIGGNLTTAGISTLNNTLNVNTSGSYIANFVNSNVEGNGISIQVGKPLPDNGNNFVTFKNGSGNIVGRIEGETIGELNNNEEYLVTKRGLELTKALSAIDVATGAVGVIMAGVELVAAASSSTACAGLGVCVTAPVPSLIVAAGVNLATAIANEVAVALGLNEAINQLNFFTSNKNANIGVTYQSGSGDYAEYLPKASKTEQFKAGYIVGLKNGKISLNTNNADKLFAISTKPIVLGNMQEESKLPEYEKVAFMGQVPVYVLGKVNTGDYIVPSGYNNGYGKAVSPKNMKPEDYVNIVGMAWSASTSDSYGMINVAIGLNTGDISKLVAEQHKEISMLKTQIDAINTLMAKLVPGFAAAAGLPATEHADQDLHTATSTAKVVTTQKIGAADVLKQDASNIIYFDISNEQVTEMLGKAQEIFTQNGGDIAKHPFWQKFVTDPGYKAAVMEGMKDKFKSAMHIHKSINNTPSLQVK